MASQVALNSNANPQVSELNVGLKPTQVTEDAKALEKQAQQVSNAESKALLEEVKKSIELDAQKKGTVEELNQEDIEKAIEVVSNFMDLPIRSVNFAQADGVDKTIIKVFDVESKELIKQFPSDELIEIAQKITELRQDVGEKTGILLDEKV